jgi:hypothetical protein
MPEIPEQEWRVEADLDDDAFDRLREQDLGRGVIVTRDGSRLFAYTTSEATAGQAARVLREFGDVSVTVWDEERDAWLDAEHGDVVEDPRADQEGPEYFVLVETEDQAALEALAERMTGPVELRRGKLLVGSYDDEEVEALADRLRRELPDARVQVRADIFDELPSPGFLWFEQRLPGM